MTRLMTHPELRGGPHPEDPFCSTHGCRPVEVVDHPHEDEAACGQECEDRPTPKLDELMREREALTITQEAEHLVYGDRQTSYEHPKKGFGRTADIWDALLRDKLKEGVHLDARDVALLMTGIKLAREAGKPKRDNRVDIAGYALCLDRLEEDSDD